MYYYFGYEGGFDFSSYKLNAFEFLVNSKISYFIWSMLLSVSHVIQNNNNNKL